MVKVWNFLTSYLKKYKNLTFIGIANALGAIAFSIYWLFVARLLGAEGYGHIGYLLSIGTITSTFALLGSPETLAVYRAKGVRLESVIFLLVIIITTISSTVLFFVVHSVELSLYIFGFAMFSLVLHEKLGSKDYLKYSIYYLTQRILTIILSIVLYHIIEIDGIILGYALSFTPFFILVYKTLKNTPLDFSLLSKRTTFLILNYSKTIFNALYLNIDKVLIFPLFGAIQLGQYYLGFQVFNTMVLLSTTIFQFTIPEDSSGEEHKKLKKYTIFISIIISLAGIFLSPFLIPFLLPKFTDSIFIIQIMSLGVLPFTIGLMYASTFLGNEKIRTVIIGKILSVFSLIIGIIFLGNIYGVIGIAISFTISTITQTLYFFIMNRTHNFQSHPKL